MKVIRLLGYALPVGPLIALGLFVHWFEPFRVGWLVDGLWLLAQILWVLTIRISSGPIFPETRPSWLDLLPIAIILLVLVPTWLPFYDNWRWAYTGDSIAWYGIGWDVATHGLRQDILNLHGVDDNFTYLHCIAFNSLQWLFGPGLFWHRVGKLIVSCLALSAIYLYFTVMLGRWWATAVVFATVTNYVWLWFSYISYGHMDSYIFYFLTLTVATFIWRRPDRIGQWLICGLIGGWALFFTQTSWSAVAIVGVFLGAFALCTRHFAALAVYAVSFLLAATPVLLQLPDLLRMTTRQAGSVYKWDYLQRTFLTIVRFPYTSPYAHIGVLGGFMRSPLDRLYEVGTLLSVICFAPIARRTLRLPMVVPLTAGLLLWDAILMTATNNGYEYPSTKRAFTLIPFQNFLALAPFIALSVWIGRSRRCQRACAALVAIALATSATNNFRQIAEPVRGLYGFNAFDGLIELRQRFAARKVLLLTSRRDYLEALGPEGFFHQQYKLLDQLEVGTVFTPESMQRGCSEGKLICYETNTDQELFAPLLERFKSSLQRFPLINTKDLFCYECRAAGSS